MSNPATLADMRLRRYRNMSMLSGHEKCSCFFADLLKTDRPLVIMGQDGVDLEWKMYENISRNSFRTLYSDTDFTDVTLACEDNKKVMAHKVVLSRFTFCSFCCIFEQF